MMRLQPLLAPVMHRINVAGRKVQPEEIEAALRSVPGVHEAVVLGLDRGSQVEEVAAVIAGPQVPGMETLRALLRATLSTHKIPRRMRRVAELPRTLRGKVDLDACRQLLVAGDAMGVSEEPMAQA
jgi:acyl-coenzyme A synthetase/AMP-(fatty) acid ligase